MEDHERPLKKLASKSAELDGVLNKFTAFRQEFAQMQHKMDQEEKQKALGKSASTGGIGLPALGGKYAALVRRKKAGSDGDEGNFTKSEYTFGSLIKDEQVIAVKFLPGLGSIVVNGAQVVQTTGQAWMKGVRPGWTILNIHGTPINPQNEDEVDDLLEKLESGRNRYEVTFQKARAKFGTGIAQLSNVEKEKEANGLRLRKAFRYQGPIDRSEHRAVTFTQLERMVMYAAEYCHAWKDQAPPEQSPWSGKTLNMDFMNLYHALAWIVMPATEKRKCSYVELMTHTKQAPKWCVIHWWGLPLDQLMKDIKLHLTVRSGNVDTPYWISALALRHHVQGEEICLDKRQAPFFKAMNLCQGQSLMVLSMGGKVFSRTWCLYETSICMGFGSPSFDLAVCHAGKAMILANGLTMAEEDLERRVPGSGVKAKAAREEEFPLSVVALGLDIDVCSAETIVPEDRSRILNLFAGQALKDEAPVEHPGYDEMNKRLQAWFAQQMMLRVLLLKNPGDEGRELWDRIGAAIKADQWRKTLNWKFDGMTSDGILKLMQIFPPAMEDLTLRLRCSSIMDDDLVELANALMAHPKMAGGSGKVGKACCMNLDLKNSDEVGDGVGDDIWKAAFEQCRAIGMEINLDYTDTQAGGGEDITSKSVASCMHMSLVREGVPLKLYKRKVVPAVPSLAKILRDEREPPAARKAAARALGSLGQAAFDAVPALQAAERDDLEESVKKACTAALALVLGGSQME
mmetsp:Transcript_45335/g.119787  ORF Transcript_45335/g.119787 Transcript_45335/m.119787 type:complete len:743 (+) Transcript_45335:66-2294(+)